MDVWVLTDANGIIPPGEPVFGATSTEEDTQSQVATSFVDVIEAVTPAVTETNGFGTGGGGTTAARRELKLPAIKILGSNPITVKIGSIYTDKGATASDSLGGDLTGSIVVTSDVDTRVAGSYNVVFKVTDFSGNTATATRTVNVVGASLPDTTIVAAMGDTGRSLRSGASTLSKSIILLLPALIRLE